MGVGEVLWGLGRFVGGVRSGTEPWGRVEPVGEVSVGLFGWVWAGSAELGEGADAGEGGVVECRFMAIGWGDAGSVFVCGSRSFAGSVNRRVRTVFCVG